MISADVVVSIGESVVSEVDGPALVVGASTAVDASPVVEDASAVDASPPVDVVDVSSSESEVVELDASIPKVSRHESMHPDRSSIERRIVAVIVVRSRT